MTTQIAPVTKEELMDIAEMLTGKYNAFTTLSLDSTEFTASLTCLQSAVSGLLGTLFGMSDTEEKSYSAAIAENPGPVIQLILDCQNNLIDGGVDVRLVLNRDLSPQVLSLAMNQALRSAEKAHLKSNE